MVGQSGIGAALLGHAYLEGWQPLFQPYVHNVIHFLVSAGRGLCCICCDTTKSGRMLQLLALQPRVVIAAH